MSADPDRAKKARHPCTVGKRRAKAVKPARPSASAVKAGAVNAHKVAAKARRHRAASGKAKAAAAKTAARSAKVAAKNSGRAAVAARRPC